MQLLEDTPTRFSPTGRTKATLLDLVISNVDELVSDITVLPPVSDHCPVPFTVTTQLLMDDNAPSDMLVPDFTHTNFDALREHLWNQPLLESIEDSTCIESAWFTWYNYFCQSVRLLVPTRKLVSKKRRLDKPRYTSDLFKLCRKKDRIFRSMKRQNTVQAWVSYRLARNYYHAAVRRQKVQFYTKFSNLLNNERNSYRWWQQAKRFSNISVKKTAVIPDLTDGSGLASSDTEKADLLARAFSSQCSNPHRYTSRHTPAAFHDTPFDVPQLTGDEVFCALRTLPAYKATGGTIPNQGLLSKVCEIRPTYFCTVKHCCPKIYATWLVVPWHHITTATFRCVKIGGNCS